MHRWSKLQPELGGDDGSYIVDVDHHPNSRGTSGGQDWPSMLTHGWIVNLGKGRQWQLATGLEHVAALGYDLSGHAHDGIHFARVFVETS